MCDRLRLLSREHLIEFSQTAAIAAAAVAVVRFDDGRAVTALLLAICELSFAVTKTRHVSRQFASREQTEWLLTVGAIERPALARAYVFAFLWRATYHTALIGTAAAVGQIGEDSSKFEFVAEIMAWQCVVRATFATYRHIAGSRIVPSFVRAALEPAASKWWRFPAQVVLTIAVAVAVIGVFVVAKAVPLLVYCLAIVAPLLVYRLVRASESIEPVSEIAFRTPSLARAKGPIAKSRPSELLGLFWFGSKPWWKWAYLPLAVAMMALITRAPRGPSAMAPSRSPWA